MLLALSETWALREREHWPIAVFCAVLAALASACVTNTVMRLRRSRDVVARRRPTQ